MLTPPPNRADATPVLVLESDTAWDYVKIEKEKAELRAAKLDPERHPVAVYLSGETRFDLHAEIRMPDGRSAKASDYLDMAQAWQFVLKRFPWSEVYGVESAVSRDFLQGNALACRHCLVRIDGPSAPTVRHDKHGMVEYETMQELFELQPTLPVAIGVAGYQASQPLRPAEKKS